MLNYIGLYGICTCPVVMFFDKFELNQTRTFTPATTSFTILLKLQPTVAYATIKCPFGSFLLIWKYHKMWAEKCVNIDSDFSESFVLCIKCYLPWLLPSWSLHRVLQTKLTSAYIRKTYRTKIVCLVMQFCEVGVIDTQTFLYITILRSLIYNKLRYSVHDNW